MTLMVMVLAFLLGIVKLIQILEMMAAFPGSLTIDGMFLRQFLPSLFWLVVAPLLAFMGQRIRPGVFPLPRVALAHLAVGALIAFSVTLLHMQLPAIVVSSGAVIEIPVEGHEIPPEADIRLREELPADVVELLRSKPPVGEIQHTWVQSVTLWISNLLTYAMLVIIVMSFQLYRDVQDRQAQADRLQSQLALSQLGSLRMQLRPHFLFNTLNSISTLMPRDTEAARRMVSQLADLLRASFSKTQKHETALKNEVELLYSYLEIQKARFGETLQVRFEVDADVHEAHVPSLCLQPLVENAVVHGLSKRAELGTVSVRAHHDAVHLFIEVSDDGVGLPDGQVPSEGIGLRNTRERLAQLYGDAAGVEIEAPASGGFVVRLRIPYHEVPVETPDGGT